MSEQAIAAWFDVARRRGNALQDAAREMETAAGRAAKFGLPVMAEELRSAAKDARAALESTYEHSTTKEPA